MILHVAAKRANQALKVMHRKNTVCTLFLVIALYKSLYFLLRQMSQHETKPKTNRHKTTKCDESSGYKIC